MQSGEAAGRDRRRNVTDRASRGGRERRAEPAPGRPERWRGPRSTERDDRAEPTARDRRAGTGERPERAGPGPGRRLTAEVAARLAASYVAEMTRNEPEGITALKRAGDGLWEVDVEVVEIHRIPDTTDILAIYRTELDPGGELVAYRRIQRYSRCQVIRGETT
ncbi:MAG: hypothetical protein JWR24_1742 [Actinoallomurus sp.]|jgi:hypothetical protein|nr:hypothetical protein [Actinoallomurus sp.]